MPDSWDVDVGLQKGECSSDTKRNRTSSNCSNSAHGGKMRRNLKSVELKMIKQEWRLQQQRMKAHERRKRILIKEYEIQRKHRLKQSTGNNQRLFKGPEGTQINTTELRKIKVDIYRNIPGKYTANELQRDIVNPEDVVVKRREGEGVKPIFEREELKRAVSNTEEVEEQRIVATVKDTNLENKPQTSKRRSASLSLTRNRSRSNWPISSRYSRHEDYKQGDKENRRNNSNRGRNRDRSRERKEDRRRTQSCHTEDEETRLKERRNRRDRSRSKERDQAKWDKDSRHNKSIGGRSTEERMPSQQIPVPIYYGNFPPSPVMVGPLVSFRGHVAFGGRYPMWPMRPFGPRFPPRIDMYRLRLPGYPRAFEPQY